LLLFAAPLTGYGLWLLMGAGIDMHDFTTLLHKTATFSYG